MVHTSQDRLKTTQLLHIGNRRRRASTRILQCETTSRVYPKGGHDVGRDAEAHRTEVGRRSTAGRGTRDRAQQLAQRLTTQGSPTCATRALLRKGGGTWSVCLRTLHTITICPDQLSHHQLSHVFCSHSFVACHTTIIIACPHPSVSLGHSNVVCLFVQVYASLFFHLPPTRSSSVFDTTRFTGFSCHGPSSLSSRCLTVSLPGPKSCLHLSFQSISISYLTHLSTFILFFSQYPICIDTMKPNFLVCI
jgi:hypothetical protein